MERQTGAAYRRIARTLIVAVMVPVSMVIMSMMAGDRVANRGASEATHHRADRPSDSPADHGAADRPPSLER
jgi:hypothetical protein